eukprot:COSAG02_NODE_1249_length_13624_cov_4.621600_8_plen_79_part_00
MCDLWKASEGRDHPVTWTRLNKRGIYTTLPALEVLGADELYVVATQDRIAAGTCTGEQSWIKQPSACENLKSDQNIRI